MNSGSMSRVFSVTSPSLAEVAVYVPGDIAAKIVAIKAINLERPFVRRQEFVNRARRSPVIIGGDAHIADNAILDENVLADLQEWGEVIQNSFGRDVVMIRVLDHEQRARQATDEFRRKDRRRVAPIAEVKSHALMRDAFHRVDVHRMDLCVDAD